jgi:MATE family multidrug resistance protein
MTARHTLRAAFALAWPASLAAIVTPLLGVVDTAVLSRGAGTADIAGVALASAVFSLLYWPLGFLRMSLAGLTAQADGRDDEAGRRAHLVQGVALGGAIGTALLLLGGPIGAAAELLMTRGSAASDQAAAAMREYIAIRLWAAPLAIPFFAGVGWLTGQGRTGLMMAVMVLMTAANAALDIHFVLGRDMGVAGIALGTAIAEAGGTLLLAVVIGVMLHRRGGLGRHWSRQRLTEGLARILRLNADIFLRTLGLALVFAWFVRAGGRFGDTVLAANQILMHVVLTAGLLLDGPAIAAETMVGRALGKAEGRREAFAAVVIATARLTLVAAIGLTGLLFIAQAPILSAIVPPEAGAQALRAATTQYYAWAAVSPLIVALPFHIDGVFIGATRGRDLRNSMIAATALFGALVLFVAPSFGNHALWGAFGAFMLARWVALILAWPALWPLLRAAATGNQADGSRAV